MISQQDRDFFNDIVWPEMWLWMQDSGDRRREEAAKHEAWKDYIDSIKADKKVPDWIFQNPALN